MQTLMQGVAMLRGGSWGVRASLDDMDAKYALVTD
jgi:hypothetical protein